MISPEFARASTPPQPDAHLTKPQNLESYDKTMEQWGKYLFEDCVLGIEFTVKTLILLATNSVALGAFYAAIRYASNDIPSAIELQALGHTEFNVNWARALEQAPQARIVYSMGMALIGLLYGTYPNAMFASSLNRSIKHSPSQPSSHPTPDTVPI